MGELGKTFIILGAVLLVVGVLLILKVQIPFIGRLPGDFFIKKENYSFYFPLTTSILVSIVLTLLFSMFRK